MKLIALKFNFGDWEMPSPGEHPGPGSICDRVGPVRVSPTQSNRIQPNPITPPPPGKEIGKETVKFLVIFDHQQWPITNYQLQITNH